jgi:hypothetical protein
LTESPVTKKESHNDNIEATVAQTEIAGDAVDGTEQQDRCDDPIDNPKTSDNPSNDSSKDPSDHSSDHSSGNTEEPRGIDTSSLHFLSQSHKVMFDYYINVHDIKLQNIEGAQFVASGLQSFFRFVAEHAVGFTDHDHRWDTMIACDIKRAAEAFRELVFASWTIQRRRIRMQILRLTAYPTMSLLRLKRTGPPAWLNATCANKFQNTPVALRMPPTAHFIARLVTKE